MRNPLNGKDYALHKSDNGWKMPQKTSGTTISSGTACRE